MYKNIKRHVTTVGLQSADPQLQGTYNKNKRHIATVGRQPADPQLAGDVHTKTSDTSQLWACNQQIRNWLETCFNKLHYCIIMQYNDYDTCVWTPNKVF